MPLSSASPRWQHLVQNLSLLALALVFTPCCTIATVLTSFLSRYYPHGRSRRTCPAPRRILVTGVGMSKGLAIARAFDKQGHDVVVADFEPNGIPVCGRFSNAVRKFYRLPQESRNEAGDSSYVTALLSIVRKEKIHLWVSCSGVASALEDARAAEAVEKETDCKAIQFGVGMTGTLHEKYSFNENTRKLGLNTPQTHLITSIEDAMDILLPEKDIDDTKYILKPVGVDDTARADMTLLPRPSAPKTRLHITRLDPSPTRPFVLQQFIQGPEYCTHSIVIRGKVMLFTACPSADMLMHYQSLPVDSPLFRVMFDYTKGYAEKMGEKMTGHFSMDFLVDETADAKGERKLEKNVYPIECNPRAHTAVVLFGNDSERMVDAYLHLLDSDDMVKKEVETVFASAETRYYWLGHDILIRLILPLLSLLTFQSTLASTYHHLQEFCDHILHWKDGTFEVWDPWPFWWLYCVYWPGRFSVALVRGESWSRCNVSTGKMFLC
ncbi:putative transporter [Venturia nashicola]|uniref:Putative transporter n=1 Tax=Venturia nashicola TaxID=86259 RepID=A0A4Z1NW42_9PEZI|nr:putative transporter [Venturia nashicola]TLD29841.1 putative transporter [Venturia nashicola]